MIKTCITLNMIIKISYIYFSVCKDWNNDFLRTCFTTYLLRLNSSDPVNELHEKTDDLKYLMNLCGSNLIRLDVRRYPTSEMMPVINANCPNLEELTIGFEEIMSQDLTNAFSNMSHLKSLTIICRESTLPMALAKSLEQTGGTLKTLMMMATFHSHDSLPDFWASVNLNFQ